MQEVDLFRLLVICTGNRARSQMAHGWIQHIAGERADVFPGAEWTLHRSSEDPDVPDLSEAELTEVFRRLRDEIEEFARDLLRTELG